MTITFGAIGTVLVLMIAITLRNIMRRSASAGRSNNETVVAGVDVEESTADVAEAEKRPQSVKDSNPEGTADATTAESDDQPELKRPLGPAALATLRNMTPQERLERVDSDGDGKITKEELQLVPRMPQFSIFRRIIDNFASFDQDNDGYLDKFEQGRVVGMMVRKMQENGKPPRRDGPFRRQENRQGPRPAQES